MANISREENITILEKLPDGSYLAKYPATKVNSIIGLDEKLLESGLTDASTTQKGIVQLNDTTSSTSSTQAATAKAVKEAFDEASSKDYVIGTYTGDNQSRKTIRLGFKPSAVIIVANTGGMARSQTVYGGMATPTSDMKNSNRVAIEIVDDGFAVFRDSQIMANTDDYLYNPFKYIAFK